MSTPALNLYLMGALNFGPEDLEANRNGAVGARQEAFHQHQAARMRRGVLSVLALIPVIGAGAFMREAARGNAPDIAALVTDFHPAYLIPLGVLVVYIGVMLYLALFWKTSIAGKRVEQVEGPVDLKLAGEGSAETQRMQARTGMDPMRGRLKVGREIFTVSEHVLRAFKPGAVYRIYYVRHGLGTAVGAQRQIIGAELIADNA